MTMTWPLLDGAPEAIVATDPARRWRRAELIEAAQEAAALLQGAGLAALWLPHRALALAAVVGALQAHTPYLPLDPRAPRALTQATLADANPRRALWPLGEAPPPGAAAPDRHGRWFCSASLTQTPSAQEPPPEAAYLLYTSGSVGRPRGVLQARAGLEGHARRYAASLGLTAQDRLLMLASVATDAAVMDLFGALASGASLHLWDLRAAPLADLEALVAREAITILHMTPTVFRAWVAAAPAPSSLQTARALVLGGERARASDVHHHRRLFPAQSVLINGLGPTECTMALQRRFTAQEPPPDDPLPVGWPLPGIEARLLDEAQDGSGELALCGEDLALGYWRRPEETARAFVALPDGRRLYRTGDKARRGADGQWIALGRLGRAHKIRGVQVDLDALEALLERAPGVARAAVEVEDTARGDRLRAWIAPAPGHALALAPLRAWLRARALPEQLPARWHLLEAPPLTTSGKLDRAALRASSSPQGPTPQTLTGRWLAARWAALLGAEDLHEDSDFFAEGGDSLAALALQDALRRERGVWLPLERLFDGPRLADLAAWIDAQAPEPQQETTGLSGAMTPQELSIWLAQASSPGSDAWHVPALQRLRGGDPAALRRALEEVYAATPGLRRRVARAPGAPPALVEGAAPLPWVALRAASADEGVRMAQAAASAPFDLERGPLLRATWIEVEGDDALLLLVAHHLILDGEGMRALMAAWSARSRGEPLPDDLRLARAPSGEDSAAWWRAQPRHAVSLPAPLEGDPGNDPADKGRQWSLDAASTGRLRAWAASQRATLGMAALTALAATLSRALGERLTLGLVASAPTRAGWAQCAIQALPLALALDPDEPATALLARARALALAALERPTPDLAALGPAPQVVFVMHGAPRPALAGQGEALALEPRDSPAPLLFSARDGGAALELGAAWRPEAISPWVAERLVELWAAALERLAATPDASVGALCELTASQRAWLRRQQGPARPDMDLERAIPALALEAAARAPGAVAVVEGERAWTYAEVTRRAAAVARWLRAQGVARGALVPVLSPRSGELPALWLGILWVGAVIVPLDPRWPDARLAEALARLRPAAALAHPAQAARPALAAIPALGWDGEDGEPPPLEPATGHEPVYAIFTSGTTGAPRLALNHARGLNNRLRCMDEAFSKDQITLQTTHHAYDTAIWQLLWPLTRGAQVHVPPDEALVSPEALLGCVRRGVTVLDLVPSVARALAPGLRASPEAARRLASVQHLILGGEAPTVADAAALRSLCPSASLYNIYGPTEATIGCLVHEVRGDAPGPIPMGRPLANVQAVILDARGALALPGVEGELVLGGVCVGLGYAGDPEATARAFPWRDLWGEGTQRLYRTGDRAVYRADGALVFLGRGDGQVKIRGVRLELRGIEAALARAAPQHDLAMLALEGPRGAELVAFVAPGPIPDALTRAAEATLEPAARPARWIALPALPLAPSGKRDEAALRALGLTSPPPRLTTDAPGALGAVLAVWSELLGAPVTDPESNFLHLGGHSLLWVEVQHRLEARLAREIPVSLLLQAPTARALAAHLEAPPADAAPRGRHVVRRPRPA